ncbi:TULIP family P47-like protein [Dyadobacter sp. NIV53]|uniref:TULIP family P47-like protein n=1 Tax=Dyadobacter sp. NIV53 TaxID=2861765 RepID=UPI001C882518|nr:TULIP family P47-like protein [Dyadobacter sp. NIV53]
MITEKSAPAVLTDTSSSNADTYGWDNVFALNFIKANDALTKGWANVDSKAKNLVQSFTDDDTGVEFDLDSTFGPWQLTENGDGKNIRMVCPIISGTYKFGKKSYDFSTYTPSPSVVIEVNMNWVPDPGQAYFVVDTGVDGIVTDLNQNTIDSTLTAAFTHNGKTLSNTAYVSTQKTGYEWLVQDGETSYYIFYSADKDNDKFLTIYQFEKAWKNNLQVLSQGDSSNAGLAVVIVTINNNPLSQGTGADVFAQILTDWFNTNIGYFNYVFSSLDLSPQLSDSDQFKWILPTATSYAVTDQGSLDTSIFGVLTMNLNHPAASNHQVSPYAIPAGADAGFLISAEMFLANMLLSGVCTIFNNADPSNFIIDNDSLGVTNNTDMIWGKFMLDDNKLGNIDGKYSTDLDAANLSTDLISALESLIDVDSSYKIQVTSKGAQWLITKGSGDEYILDVDGSNIDVYLSTDVTIGKGNFTMSLVNSQVIIDFTGLKYSYTSDYDVFVNYNEKLTLKLNEHNVFWFDQVTQNMTISVVRTKSAITRDIVEGAVAAALALISLAGPIIEGLAAASEVTELSEDGGTAVLDEESFVKIGDENPDAEAANERQASGDAAAQSKGKLTNIKAAFKTPKWKFMGSLAALAAAVAGVDQSVDAILEKLANDSFEDVPGLDLFANEVIGPYSWPGVSNFTLNSATLAGSLQIGLKTS